MMIIAAIIALIALPAIMWFLIPSSLARAGKTFINVLEDDASLVDPDAPIHPSQERKSSEVIEEQAQMVKQQPMTNTPIMSTQTAQPAAAMPRPAIPAHNPPPMSQTITPEGATLQPSPSVHAQPPIQQVNPPTSPPHQNDRLNDLVERIPPVQPQVQAQGAPLTEPNLQPLDDDVVYVEPKADKLEYGVKYNDHSPGRIMRDKRYERNAVD